ncbi:beta strand repeat-containing protein, partial [Chitinophaga silvisoli]
MREQNKLLVNKLLVAFLFLLVSKVSLAQCTTDLALGKAVTSSSVNANNYAYYATDGNTTTRWESAWSDPQWIMVDLGGRYPICTVNITWENARGQDFLVQVSDDASNWRTKATITGNTALNNSYSFTDTARYVRMYGTARVLTGYGYSIYTLEVLGTAPTTICSNLNVAQSRPGFASSVVGANAVANAFDNSATTRWESASSDPQYIYVDLGAQYDLCRVALTWEAAYGKDFTIDISSNGSTWTTAATIVGNYIKNNSIAISGQARYVRMRGTARGTTYGYSLYDFAVYAMLPALSVKKLTDAAEPGTGGSFRFSLPTGITYTENITVNYTVTGTAASGTDYTSLPASVVIPAGTNYVDVSYNTNDDKIIEGNETVIVTLTSAEAGSSTTYVTFPLSATDYSATSTISDDDNTATNMVLNLAVTTGAWEPATDGVFTLSLPTGYTAKEDVTVNYTVSGTATAGTDYTTLSGTVVLPALSNSVTIPVTITDDKIIEGTETLALTWNQGTSPTLGTFSGSGIATMGVIDDDNIAANKVFTIVADGDAAEPSTNGAFKISLPAGVSVVEDVTVNYTVAGTATPGADYNTLAGTVNFPAGSNSISLPVTVIDDNDIEATETVIATLTGGSAATFGTFTGTANATVNIADNDVVPANKEVVIAGTTNGTEPSANGVFTVSLPGGISYPEPITVNYTVSGTAIAGTDYTTLSGTVTIPAGVNSAVINVPVLDDDLIEVDETVIVTLTSAAAPSFGSFIANTSATINIADNEPRLLGISAFNNLSEPSTDGTVAIAIMGAGNISSTEPITVTYTVTELGATVDEDYEPLSGTVTIPAGDPYVTVPIRVKDDKIIEGTENLRFTISGGTSPNLGAFTPNGAYASQDLSINDDEQKIVTITKATDASEPSTNGAFMVSLPAGTIATEDITVNYTVSGTATEGDDYNAMTGTVTIFAGDNSANIPVEVIDDQQIENPETVIATLTGASAATLGAFTANTNATLTIADDEDKTITIANAANGAEPSANGTFTVSLPTGITATEDITLTYSVSGTATPGADYTTLSGTVTIAAGDNSAIIDVPVLSDNIIEADETVTVTLTAASGATLGTFTANTSATITIADGTNKTLSIANTADGAEPATKGSFRVALPAGITATEDLTLTYTVSGSATPGDDYTALSGTVSIPAGDNTATIDVPVIDDQVIEANETVTVTLTGASATNLGTFTANADATVTITDNDAGSVTIANAADAAEPGANGAFIVNLPAGLTASEDVTVYYTVTGTATPGSDYTSLGGVATIPAGNNSATIPITVIDDKIIEVGETVVVTLTSATTNNLGSFTANNNATVTIADDDEKTLTIAQAADAAEPSTNGAFTVSLPTGVTATEDITLTYSVSGSATGGTDYTALSGTAIIYTGNNSATISVPVINDQVIEGNETVTVTLTGASAATLGSFTANGNATVNIVDDEDKTISITNAADAAEPATPGLFKVSLPGGVTATEAITVNYTVTGGTATAGTDYTALSGTVLIPAGDNNVNIPIVVVDDKIIEGDETVILTLNGASAPTLGAFTANTAATVNIADDENRTISIANTTDASEPGTNGEFTVSLPAGVTALEDITVGYTVSGGTATAGDDYAALSGTVLIPAGNNSATIPVVVNDDKLLEGDETLVVSLTAASAPTLGAYTANTDATLTIADDESKTVTIVKSADAAEAATNGTFTIGLPAGVTANEDISVTYTVTGTATAGDDYNTLGGTATIFAGTNSVAIPIFVNDDQLLEGDETVVATLTGASSTSLGAFTANNAATVIIADDESKTIGISSSNAAEPGTNGAFTLRLAPGITAAEDITVTYTVSGTATAGTDYTNLGGTATILAGSNSAIIDVAVIDDQIIEGAETVTVTLTGASGATLGTLTANAYADLTIVDDEVKVVSIANTADAAEPATNGGFIVSLPGGVTASENITVTYTITGTAIAGSDYTTLSGSVVIPAGANSATIDVAVIDDQVIEGDETVIVTLTGASATTLGSFTANGNATVTIADDEDKNISITKAADAAEAATNGAFTVSLPSGVTAAENITVTYATTGTAAAGSDYNTLAGSVVIPAGANSTMIDVVVTDDQVVEGDETVILTLTGASTTTLGSFTANGNATVTIADDENRTISITKAADAAEAATNGAFTVSLPSGVTATEAITITYTLTGTASAGSDYTTLTGSVVIPAGANSTNIDVQVMDDQVIEGDETVIVTLTGASATTLGSFTANNNATLTIADDENKTISITKAADAAEPAINGAFTVSLPSGVTATEAITITYTSTGTATAGTDYNTLTGSVIIPAGANSATIDVAVADDQVIEGDETVIVTLTGASATTLGSFTANNNATVTIADDENKTISITKAADAAEPTTNGAFTVSLPSGVTATEAITVNYIVTGTATASTDYNTLTGSVVIPAGANSANIDVQVIDDQVIEGDETVLVTLTGASATTLGSFTANNNATLIIADDGNKIISITKAADAAEPATNGAFTVSLPSGVTATEAITVNYIVTGTATTSTDYNTLTGSVVIPAGANSANIDVQVIDDQVIEGDETVLVTLTGASATTLGSFTANNNATVTIADDEDKTISITKATDAAEPATNGAFTVSLPSGVSATEAITVTYTVTGTATAGTDYTALSGSVVIPAGANSANIDVQVIDDQIIEGDETVIVTLTGASASTLGTFTANSNATVTIADDENKTISITKAADAAEPATNGAFTVSLPSGVSATEAITVTYTVTGTATAGTDYTALSGSVVIPAGANSANIDVQVIDDQIIEGDETVIVTLTGASASTLGTFTANSNATVTIADDENKTISITKAADAAEPATNGAFTVSLPSGVSATEAITVTYTVTGTATAGTDYTALSGSVVIPAGANSTTIDVAVIDDQLIEADEAVIATLTGAAANTLGAFTANNNATVTIADNEDRTITIAKTTDAAEPSVNGAFTVSLASGVTATEDINITYTISGTATANDDYTALSGSVTILAGTSSTNIPVLAKDDQIIETDETVIATLTAATATNLGTFTATQSATVTIADNDAATITIAKTADAAEPNTNGHFTVSYPTGVTAVEDVLVGYTVTGAATAGADYTTLPGTVTIPAGQNSATIDINVIDDNIYEGNEDLTLTLSNAFGTQLGTITVAGNATLTISDDDSPVLTIVKTTDVAEPTTNGGFTVSMPTGVTSTQAITFNYTVSGTATAGSDYTALSGTATIPAGVNSITIPVSVVDDKLIEGDETVIVTITDATASSATLIISDDENKTITIASTTNAAEPSTNGVFTVSLAAGVTATEDITVTYTVSGSATASTDYNPLSGTVTIPAGANSANIDVTVIDDQTIEADETVIATLTTATAPTLGTFTANTSATVTIADDENKTISIVNTANASEPATNGVFTVSLPTGVTATEDISVTYTISGTATASTDYNTLSGTVTIPAGANSANIDVKVIDDQTIEADETVIATLTAATAPTLGTFTANTSATVTIADDENKTISIV